MISKKQPPQPIQGTNPHLLFINYDRLLYPVFVGWVKIIYRKVYFYLVVNTESCTLAENLKLIIMAKTELNEVTKQVLKDLQEDISDMLKMSSNIEVIWKLENLHFNDALHKSAELIRKSIKINSYEGI